VEPLLLAVALVAYNGLVNLWGPFHGPAYVPMNLAVAGAVIGVGLGPLGLGASEIGFDDGWGADAGLGAALGAALAAPVLVAAFHPRTRRFVADERVRDVEATELAYRMIVRIPLGTAFLEEIAFRGVLFGAWRQHGVAVATVGSAVAFGLWHITPTWNLIRANRPSASGVGAAAGIAAAVATTTAAGAALAALRDASGGLAAPLALHATLNALATAAAAVAHHKT
jgi:membrane protease YdiL (CAAX protease family)